MARRLRLTASTGDRVTARLAMPSDPGPLGIVLAHGAGVGQDHPWMVMVRDGLSGAGFPTMTFNYAYTEAGRRAPDRPDRMLAVHEAAVARMETYVDDVALAGKSMGGRMGAHLVGDRDAAAAAVVYYGYPLVPMGKGAPRPIHHLERIQAPQLFFCGTRDRLSRPALIKPLAHRLPWATVIVVPDGDHSFNVPKRSGRTPAQVLGELVTATAAWLSDVVA